MFQFLKNKAHSFIHHSVPLYNLRCEQYATYLKLLYNKGEVGVSDEELVPGKQVIVSLTTYSKRLYDVYLTVESIMQQTMKPNKIVLWLSDEYSDRDIPLHLKRQQERGLEIHYCNDIRSYKKLIPSLKLYPDDIIITVDDDLYYYDDIVEKLVKAYLKDSSLIYCNRLHRINFDSQGNVRKYKDWIWNYKEEDVSPLNFPTGCAGIIYPPHCFSEEVFNENVFMNICRTADDIWFKAMALYNNYQSRKVFTHNLLGEDYYDNDNVQDIALSRINVIEDNNDVQFKAVFDKYNLYPLLKR